MPNHTPDPIVNSVIDKYITRSEEGMKKYGVPLTRSDLELLDWINHAQEEAMDLTLYLERIKVELLARASVSKSES